MIRNMASLLVCLCLCVPALAQEIPPALMVRLPQANGQPGPSQPVGLSAVTVEARRSHGGVSSCLVLVGGTVGAGETDPRKADTDGDKINAGVEKSTTKTDPTKADTDGDGCKDGDEDTNQNGKVDAGETNPLDKSDCGSSPSANGVRVQWASTSCVMIHSRVASSRTQAIQTSFVRRPAL